MIDVIISLFHIISCYIYSRLSRAAKRQKERPLKGPDVSLYEISACVSCASVTLSLETLYKAAC